MNILILGGTGSLGRALINKLTVLPRDVLAVHNIRVLSRDEHKQAALKKDFPGVDCVLGDIRDYSSIRPHFSDIQMVFHVAALKHVDILEANVMESIKTNVLGTANAAQAAIEACVTHFIFSSTDKAIDPVNAYGHSKALAEKHLFSLNPKNRTKFSVYRWGNVLGSQGSVIPYFIKTLRANKQVYVTDREMTRFWLPLTEAVEYMIYTFRQAQPQQAMVIPQLRSAPVMKIVELLARIMGINQYHVNITGLRPGEKLHESITSLHSNHHIASNTCSHIPDDELIALLTPLVHQYDKR